MSQDNEVSKTSDNSLELLEDLEWMVLIREFEQRAELAYQQGHIGGFFHSYIGQEAVQVAAVRALGRHCWWTTSYRCHALALLLGATPNEVMAELYGRVTGNAKGRGGSMHLYAGRLLGGFGIVGGQLPIGAGAAFTLKYLNNTDSLSVCFLGDGAVAQGTFHESLNLAVLWGLPCLYVIENNEWGMGTSVHRALSVEPLAEVKAPSFGCLGATVDGMDYFSLVETFQKVGHHVVQQQKPYLLEVKTQRFKGHSISDPGLYRSRQELARCTARDPITLMSQRLLAEGKLSQQGLEEMQARVRSRVVDSLRFAQESPWPEVSSLEEGVLAPQQEGEER